MTWRSRLSAWRDSLPVRVAVATTALLTILLLALTAAAYAITAILLRQGLDDALRAALPARAEEIEEYRQEWEHHQGVGQRRELVILDLDGAAPSEVEGARMPSGAGSAALNQVALAQALREGEAVISVVEEDGAWRPRTGPDWWQAMTPQEDELRVLYRLAGRPGAEAVLQVSAPVESAGEILPDLLQWLLLLVVMGAALSGLIAWQMAAQTYRPLRAITATADDISTRTLSMRIPDVWQDRTLRRLIAVLNAMIGRLQEAFDAQGRFTAAAAHELRGPLAAMRTELEVTLRRERTAAEYRGALAGALEETERLAGLAEHLLTLSRYEYGSGFAMERGVPLAPLLARAATEVQRTAGGEVEVSAPPELLVECDPIALERAVANLVRNGIQAGGSPVRVEAATDGEDVQIQVTDRGCGIAPEALPHLFEPFYRGDPARGRDGGTGLGLAIVKTVVEAHRGRIRVDSRPGAGAVFRLWLPLRQS